MSPDSSSPEQADKMRNEIQQILIADDNYENRYLLEALLKGNGYLVFTAENGTSALEKLKTERVDAIISDILMPEMDGFQLCRTLKKDPEFAHIPFIFYTASYTETKDREFGLSLGADEYVSKPIEPEDFMGIIRRVMERSEQKEQPSLDDLSYYATYADTLGRKLEKKGVESDQQRELARVNEEKYKTLFEMMAEGVVYQDKTGAIIDANSSAERILGLTRDQLLGRVSIDPRWRSIKEDLSDFPGEEHPGMVTLRTGEKATAIMGVYNPVDDQIHWILINAVPLFQPGEETPFQVFTNFEDITREQEIKNTLYASEKKYRELVENISDTLFSVNPDGIITYISPSISIISGFPPSYYTGINFLDIISPDDRDTVERWFENVLHNHSIPVVEFRGQTSKTEIRHLRVKASPVRVNDQVVEVTGILSDITAWKESDILKSERVKEIQALLSLHLLMQKTEDEIFEFALQAVLDVTKSKVGFIAFISAEGKQIDFQIWSPEVEKTCLIQERSPHAFTSPKGLIFECITKKRPVIINDYPSSPDHHGYPEGHVPILRFLEVPILNGEQVTAIIAVANRKEQYTEMHANSLNTLGNTLWEIINLKRSDKEIQVALSQISKNMEQMATLNDTIRNPLAVLAAISDLVDEPLQSTMMQAIRNIDSMITMLDQGWIQSEKVKDFLIKHYKFKREDFG